jgi:FkbM family methyltransferase
MAWFEYGVGLTDRLGPLTETNLDSVVGETPLRYVPIRTNTLDQVLEESRLRTGQIGYLNVDCEGHDLQVIQGLNLGRYRPAIITIEANCAEEKSSIESYLSKRGYEHNIGLYYS